MLLAVLLMTTLLVAAEAKLKPVIVDPVSLPNVAAAASMPVGVTQASWTATVQYSNLMEPKV